MMLACVFPRKPGAEVSSVARHPPISCRLSKMPTLMPPYFIRYIASNRPLLPPPIITASNVRSAIAPPSSRGTTRSHIGRATPYRPGQPLTQPLTRELAVTARKGTHGHWHRQARLLPLAPTHQQCCESVPPPLSELSCGIPTVAQGVDAQTQVSERRHSTTAKRL